MLQVWGSRTWQLGLIEATPALVIGTVSEDSVVGAEGYVEVSGGSWVDQESVAPVPGDRAGGDPAWDYPEPGINSEPPQSHGLVGWPTLHHHRPSGDSPHFQWLCVSIGVRVGGSRMWGTGNPQPQGQGTGRGRGMACAPSKLWI